VVTERHHFLEGFRIRVREKTASVNDIVKMAATQPNLRIHDVISGQAAPVRNGPPSVQSRRVCGLEDHGSLTIKAAMRIQ
jgi:hypothetical protein